MKYGGPGTLDQVGYADCVDSWRANDNHFGDFAANHYLYHHALALEAARRYRSTRNPACRAAAYTREGWGQHFLTDTTALGHGWTPPGTYDGTTYDCQIRTMGLDMGTNKRKFVEEVRLICDKESTGTVTLEANDEDFDSTAWKTLGTFQLGTMEPKIHRCGSHKGKRSYRLTHSTNGPFRAEALEIRYRGRAH